MLTTKNCVYMARSKTNNKVYIGKTQCMLQERIRNHKRDSRKNKCASKFYNHVNKYGWDDIEWSILLQLDSQSILSDSEKELLCSKEMEYIEFYDSINSGLNIMRGGIQRKTGDWRKKSSEYMKEKWSDPQYRQEMINMLNSKEHRQKIQKTRKLTGNVAFPKIKTKKQKPPRNIIYKATSKTNGLIYVGFSTVGIKTTKANHNKQSKRYNSKFYRHIQNYGIDDLLFEILYVFHVQERLSSENKQELKNITKKYIAQYDSERNGLNTAPTEVSDDVRKKIGYASANRPREVYEKMSIAQKGRSHPRKGISKYNSPEEKRLANLERTKLKRRANGSKEYNKYTNDEISAIIDMIKIGLKPRHIIARGISQSLLNKAQRTMKK